MLHAIVSTCVGLLAFIGSLFGAIPLPAPAPQPIEQTLGTALPSGTAVFETSLQSRISSTDTSMMLVANSVRGGSTLAGFQCFTVDEGRTDAEYICGSISGTSVTGLTRGIDPQTGTTTNNALKFAHRVGANVKITDFPVLQILRNQANGADTYPNVLRYAPGVTPTSPNDLTDKEYADSLAFNGAGIIDATAISKGVSELASGCEAASSTVSGGSGPLVIPASIATSSYNAALAPCKVLVAGNDGLLDQGFLPSTITKTVTLGGAATSNIASTTVYATTTSGTWTKPANLKFIIVEVVGGGAGGGGATNISNGSGGGGGGGYCKKVIPAAALTSTVAITIGAAGAGGTTGSGVSGGNSSFGAYGAATGGSAGGGGSVSGVNGGAGGTATGCDVNIPGGQGGGGAGSNTAADLTVGGFGGSTPFGFGGPMTAAGATTASPGWTGVGYGAGGGGSAQANSAADNAGGAGTAGVVIITNVFY